MKVKEAVEQLLKYDQEQELVGVFHTAQGTVVEKIIYISDRDKSPQLNLESFAKKVEREN